MGNNLCVNCLMPFDEVSSCMCGMHEGKGKMVEEVMTLLSRRMGKGAATKLFDAISGASYYGFFFTSILAKDDEAFKAALTLAKRLRAHRIKGMGDPEGEWLDELLREDGENRTE